MDNLNSRILKVFTGSILIGLTLITGGSQTGTTPILALVAVPFIVSGIMNWKPVEWCAKKLAGFIKPVIQNAKIGSHGA